MQKVLWWRAQCQCIRSYCSVPDLVKSFQSNLMLLGLSLNASLDKFVSIVKRIKRNLKLSRFTEVVLISMWSRNDQYLVFRLTVTFAGHLCPPCWGNLRSRNFSCGPWTPDSNWIKSFKKWKCSVSLWGATLGCTCSLSYELWLPWWMFS